MTHYGLMMSVEIYYVYGELIPKRQILQNLYLWSGLPKSLPIEVRRTGLK